MTTDHVWRQIEQLLASAERRVLLITPFIKQDVFAATLAAIPRRVQEIRCITRWSVAEVAAGVSDPEIADLAANDGRASVQLCHKLHAKLYVADQSCLIGSANLTRRATGLVPAPNVELLLETDTAHPEVRRVLQLLDQALVPGTVDLGRQIREQADLFRTDEEAPRLLVVGHDDNRQQSWFPETRNPARLYPVYNGRTGHIGPDVLAGVLRDLAALDIGPGLNEQAFGSEVLSRLHAIPGLRRLIDTHRINMDDLKTEIHRTTNFTEEQARRSTETIAEWLRYFDEIHVVPVGTWEIRHGRELS